MEAGYLFLLTVLHLSAFPTHAWDVAVAVGDKIQFLETSGAVVGNVTEGMAEVRSLAYNTDLRRMYFSDSRGKDGSIFSMTVPSNVDLKAGNHTATVYTVVKEQVYQVKGIVYDDMTGILYWSNGQGHSIMWIRVSSTDQPQAGQPLIRVEDQIPMGIAIDNCKRYLYWTNCGSRPSLERSLLDGSERETLVFTDLALPYAVVVDQTTDRLYWVDERPGIQYRIESVDLNGKDRRIVVEGSDHQPFALAVSSGQVFWADHIHTSVWRQQLDKPAIEPIKVMQYRNSPLALVSSHSGVWTKDKCNPVIEPVMKVIPATVTKAVTQPPVSTVSQSTNSSRCFNKGIFLPDRGYCDCLPGYSGELCEIDECLDYCVHGACHSGSQGRSCTCQEGYTGERCEVSVCHNFCVTGSCSIDLTGTPQCHCQAGFSGVRCEINYTQQEEMKDNLQQVCHTYCRLWSQHATKDEIQPFQVCSCPETSRVAHEDTVWSIDYTLLALLALCIVLAVLVVVLTKRVMVLRRRPRIKKRIIVNKNITQPLTSRPTSPNGEQCEITIENCCNMNICETPCFEPDFRQPEATLNRSCKETREEKKGLLGNMELPPDDLY